MKKILTCAALLAILLSGCSFNKTGIIKVNDSIITKSQFDNMVDDAINNHPVLSKLGGSGNFVKSDENAMYRIFKERAVNQLITKTLLDDEIEKRGIKVSDEDFKAELKTVIDRVGSNDELNKILKQRGIKNKDFTNDLKNQIKVRKLIETTSNITISDADAEKYYKTNLNKFKHEEKVRASHILISADILNIIKDQKAKNKNISTSDLNKLVEEISYAQERKALAILKEVKANPSSFERIAMEKSDDKGSAERGGELGFFSKTDMVPEFSNAAFSMKPNTISDTLVKTNYGYHIIKVTDRMEAGTTPFVKVKDDIKFYLKTQEELKVLANIVDGLMKSAKIEYIDESFNPQKQVVKPVKDEKKNVK